MSIDAFYTESITPYTITESATFPYDKAETAGTAFRGAIDLIGSNEQWADAELVARSSHWLACETGVTLTRGMRLRWGARTFEITGVPDAGPLKAGHHQEVYLKEIA